MSCTTVLQKFSIFVGVIEHVCVAFLLRTNITQKICMSQDYESSKRQQKHTKTESISTVILSLSMKGYFISSAIYHAEYVSQNDHEYVPFFVVKISSSCPRS